MASFNQFAILAKGLLQERSGTDTLGGKEMKVSKALLVFLIVVLPFASFLSAQSTDQKESGKSAVNINTAGQSDLERLPGIGPSLAKKILEFRQKNGNFKTPADLMAVQGIGEKKYEQLKSMITVK
jgi:competence protein ComEA